MRKTMIIPAMALSLMTFGAIAGVTTPAGAHQVHTGEDGDDSTTVTVPAAGGGSSSGASSGGSSSGSATPSGGVATGAGGTAVGHENDLTPWLATGATGIALVGVGAATRRRRTVKA